MGKRSIEPYVHAQVVALYQSGLNLSKVSEQLQVCRCCVSNTITKFEEYTKFDDLVDQKVFLIAIYVNSKGWSKMVIDRVQAKITTDLNISLFKPVSKRTVRRYLKKIGYEHAVKIKRQWLSTKHRKARVRWCE